MLLLLRSVSTDRQLLSIQSHSNAITRRQPITTARRGFAICFRPTFTCKQLAIICAFNVDAWRSRFFNHVSWLVMPDVGQLVVTTDHYRRVLSGQTKVVITL